MREKMNRNISVYYRFKFSQNMLIIGPVLVPYMLFKGLSYSEMMFLQSISAVAVVLFEVPTGSIADRVSRKFSLVISSVITAFGLSLYIVCESFLAFALAELLFGLGMTFSSGADSAILFESLSRMEREKEYSKIEAKAMSNIFVGQAVGSIASGLLYSVSPYIPFWISLGMLFLSSGYSLFFTEPDHGERSRESYLVHVARSFGDAVKKPRVRWALYFSALMGVMLRASFWLYEPYFKLVRLDIALYGIVFAGFNVVCALSSRYLMKLFENVRPRKSLTFLGLLMGGAYLIPLILLNVGSLAFLALGQIVRALYQPIMRFYINRQIEDAFRATIISIVSLTASLSFAVFSPLIGLGLDRAGAISVYLVMGLVSVGGSLFLWRVRNLQKRKKAAADRKSALDETVS